ncbi:hypothetical protein JWV37_05185 [Sulfurospirillum sp. T05]|uniref:Uncharacterized protein n=1 Tax=Sulfurospirillum tamanense TaxID=2813362 RepID=A0ABS2WSM6_9BACT|nr:hypothetical protein [Sulfurospirillum tamanensis]MBN2964164.1 hypothetical protein [Sulfurospirillum tamanensis]
MVLGFSMSLALYVSSINDYPYLEKRVPRPQKKEVSIDSTVTPRDFNKKADDYNRCMNDGKSEKDCRHLLGPTYHFNIEIKP